MERRFLIGHATTVPLTSLPDPSPPPHEIWFSIHLGSRRLTTSARPRWITVVITKERCLVFSAPIERSAVTIPGHPLSHVLSSTNHPSIGVRIRPDQGLSAKTTASAS